MHVTGLSHAYSHMWKVFFTCESKICDDKKIYMWTVFICDKMITYKTIKMRPFWQLKHDVQFLFWLNKNILKNKIRQTLWIDNVFKFFSPVLIIPCISKFYFKNVQYLCMWNPFLYVIAVIMKTHMWCNFLKIYVNVKGPQNIFVPSSGKITKPSMFYFVSK